MRHPCSSRIQFRGLITIAIFLLLPLLLSPSAYAAPPKGAVKLPLNKVFSKNGFSCGHVAGKWIPGRMLATGHFYSHTAERNNARKAVSKAKGRKKKQQLTKLIKQLTKLIGQRNPVCAPGLPVPTRTPVATSTPARTATPAPTSTPTNTPTSTPTRTPEPLAFNFTGAVGIAKLAPAGVSSMNAMDVRASEETTDFVKIASDGTTASAISSGSASIEKFLIDPKTGRVYIMFNNPTDLLNPSVPNALGGCTLAEVDRNTGLPTCIENDLILTWFESTPTMKPVQFDQAGNIYYLGFNATERKLRRNASGEKVDLVSGTDETQNFHVLADGTTLISGVSADTGDISNFWIRRISPAGQVSTLFNGTYAYFFREFPDGNVYIGGSGGGAEPLLGVARYLKASDSIDPARWFENSSGATYNNVAPLCHNDSNGLSGFCGSLGAFANNFIENSQGEVFAIHSVTKEMGHSLVRYYPTLSAPTLTVTKIDVVAKMGDKIAIAGRNSADRYLITMYDTVAQTETQLNGIDNEVQAFHLNFIQSSNTLMFDGLRIQDSTPVVGVISLDTLEVTITEQGNRFEDFETF